MYLVNDKKGRWILKALDLFLGIRFLRKQKEAPRSFKKILICNIAHLGDVVLSTSILPWISSHYPDATIGFLAGSWAHDLLEKHKYINRVHTIDHWKLDRSSRPLSEKIRRYCSQKKVLIRDLRKEEYDLAIDLYPFFPNAIPWLSKAKIPMRIGYTSGGFGPCLTHPAIWEKKEQSMVYYFQDLMTQLSLPLPQALLPCLTYKNETVLSVGLPSKKYCLFHVGSGAQKKEWSVSHWKALLQKCKERNWEVLFSGRGEREQKMIAEITQEGWGINLCDKLSLRELMQVIQKAECIVTIDSVTGHLASAFQVPTVVLFSGMNDIKLWAPVHAQVRRVHTTPSCFPCLNKEGCKTMRCLQEVSVERVMEAVCSLGL